MLGLSCIPLLLSSLADAGGSSTPAASDKDGDGVNDALDNCPLTSNKAQLDTDLDGIGNACDDRPRKIASAVRPPLGSGSAVGNFDGDGIGNMSDQCPLVPGPPNWNDVCPALRQAKTIAGKPGGAGHAAGFKDQARLRQPHLLATDGTYLYVADGSTIFRAKLGQQRGGQSDPGLTLELWVDLKEKLGPADGCIAAMTVAKGTDLAVSPGGRVFVVDTEGALYYVNLAPQKLVAIVLPYLHVLVPAGSDVADQLTVGTPPSNWNPGGGKVQKDYRERLGTRIAFGKNGALLSVRRPRDLASVSGPQNATTFFAKDSVLLLTGLDALDFDTQTSVDLNAANFGTYAHLYDTTCGQAAGGSGKTPATGKILEDFALDPVTDRLYLAGRWVFPGTTEALVPRPLYTEDFSESGPLKWQPFDWQSDTDSADLVLAFAPSTTAAYSLALPHYGSSQKLSDDVQTSAEHQRLAETATIVDGVLHGMILSSVDDTLSTAIGRVVSWDDAEWAGDQMVRLSGTVQEGVKEGEGVLSGWNNPVDMAYDPTFKRLYVIDQDEPVLRVLY